MKAISSFAVAVSLMVGGALAATPAVAQKKKQQAAAQPAGWQPKLSKEEVAALRPVEVAITAKDWAAAQAALPAAQAAATSPDGRFYVGQFYVTIGAATNNMQLQSQGIDLMLASGGGDPTKLAPLNRAQGAMAMQNRDFAKAEAAYTRWAQLAPNDQEAQIALAELKFRQKKPQEALPLFERLIAARRSAGGQVPENWYLYALQSAVDAKMAPQAQALSRTVLSAYPTPKNWRNALLIYRQNATLAPDATLDLFRLMRATKTMTQGDEYLALADTLARGRYYAEAQATLNEAIAAGKLSRSNGDVARILQEVSGRISEDRAALAGLEGRARAGANGELALRLADAYYGHGDYAKAADLYRTALQKGSVDANLVNTRLGMALGLAGRKAEAEAAFKAVTGPRAGLAEYWMLWLNGRA